MSGYIVNQPQPHSAYAISKAGVHHLARSMAGRAQHPRQLHLSGHHEYAVVGWASAG